MSYESGTSPIPNLADAFNSAIAASNKEKVLAREVDVKREGSQIILPSSPTPMTYSEAITCLQRKQKEEETVVSINETIDAFPFDGAHAFMVACKDLYGFMVAETEVMKTIFGDMEIKPETLSIETDYGVRTPIIWGKFRLPGLEGYLKSAWAMKDGRPVFKIGGEMKKKYTVDVAALAQRTREILQTQSIYRSKAISLKVDGDGKVEWGVPPSFLDLSRVNPNELTFSEETEQQVETNLFTPIEYTQACRMNHIPLKRGVLLEGPFGTGKTLTAFVTAQKARANGWTFILINRVSGLKDALTFARMYQPAVVFAEDVDREVSGEERTTAIDDVLNTIDGVESKGSEVITILTSNDVKGINRAMLRPGRLDAIISIQAPDEAAAEKLVRLYSRELLAHDADLSQASVELSGQIPAVIREVIERSKLYAINRAKNGNILITGADIVRAAKSMKEHLALMAPKLVEPQNTHEKLGSILADVVEHSVKRNGLYEGVTKTQRLVNEMHKRIFP